MPVRRARVVERAQWRIVVFGDLHFGSKTEARAIAALQQIRELAGPGGEVVCTGDFWDRRGVLSVRHLDLLVDEWSTWRDQGVRLHIVPGNHDQVSLDGLVHGVRVFEGFPNIRVYSTLHLDAVRKLAFVPWREDSEEQSRQFETLPGDDWTIFAHAEVGGAVANGGHTAKGRVTRRAIEARARACYLGHYHKRQLIGDRTWYIGSPFEQNFGEREWPHGVGIVTPDAVEPEWVELQGMPKHYRLSFGEPWPDTITAQDFVEVVAPAKAIDTEEFRAAVAELPVAPRLKPESAPPDDDLPMVSLSLDQAVRQYAETYAPDWSLDIEAAYQRILGYLAELPEARTINPLAPEVRFLRVEATDFCALRGKVAFDLSDRGLVLIQGPIGSGKTALADAITWALYGQTSPRKAGSHGASLRADEVIHDDASVTHVRVELELHGPDGPRRVSVQREKRRGSGARVRIDGADLPEGIADQQELLNRIVGLDFALWRTCVFLGQGAVGNFVTDADKARKELLSAAFGTSAFAVALKDVKAHLKKAGAELAEAEAIVAGAMQALKDLEALSGFASDIEAWDRDRAQKIEALEASLAELRGKIEAADASLADEPAWLEAKTRYDAHVDDLVRRLGVGAEVRIAAKEREMGALQAEKALAERAYVLASNAYQEAVSKLSKGESEVCPQCGQAITDPRQRQAHVEMMEQDVLRKRSEAASFDARLSNVQVELDTLRGADTSGRRAVEEQIAAARAEQAKIAQALNAFARIRGNRDDAARYYDQQRNLLTALHGEKNPYRAKQAELEAKIESLRAHKATKEAEVEALQGDVDMLRFVEAAFGAKGIPVLILRAAMYELETRANEFLSKLLGGRYYVELSMPGDDLDIKFYECSAGQPVRERRYEQLSGGQRRACELAFSPFAVGELIFSRAGVRVPLLILDEISSHLGAEEKPKVIDLISGLDRRTVLVIDHDPNIQGHIETTYEIERTVAGTVLQRVA